MEYLAAGFADGREIVNAHGQTADHYFHPEYIMHAQNNEDSNAIMVRLEASVPQATLVASTSMPNQDRAATKREKDKAYRERLKKRKIETERNMEALTKENQTLKDENRDLKAENTSLNQAFQSRGEEMDKLKHELNESRLDVKKQNGLLQTISDILADSDLSLKEENQKLQNENCLLRQMLRMDNPMSQLVEEVGKLEHDKKVMKVQLDAVCEKLIRAKIG